ncbi:hypothetical protein LUR56_00535, partial [Streptomyces sp. MT29]|nr:hypothetical protein [Streptomyces sp. MT29]
VPDPAARRPPPRPRQRPPLRPPRQPAPAPATVATPAPAPAPAPQDPLKAFADTVLDTLHRAYPSLFVPPLMLRHPHLAKLWYGDGRMRTALHNERQVREALNRPSLAQSLDDLTTTGVPVTLTEDGKVRRGHHTLILRARLTDRQFETTLSERSLRNAVIGTEISGQGQAGVHHPLRRRRARHLAARPRQGPRSRVAPPGGQRLPGRPPRADADPGHQEHRGGRPRPADLPERRRSLQLPGGAGRHLRGPPQAARLDPARHGGAAGRGRLRQQGHGAAAVHPGDRDRGPGGARRTRRPRLRPPRPRRPSGHRSRTGARPRTASPRLHRGRPTP